MRAKFAYLCLALGLAAGRSWGQSPGAAPDQSSVYCSGVVTTEPVPNDTYLISGEESVNKITFAQGDLVYLNKGSNQGVKVGDQFSVTRKVRDPLRFAWFKWQAGLLRAMGSEYRDLGRVRVVHVDPKTSTAEVVHACEHMERGDLLQPYQERPAPPLKDPSTFDPFAPVSGRRVAMVVAGHTFQQMYGRGNLVYINLGNQDVKVGDYIRVFRHQGTRAETVVQSRNYQFKMYGFGSTPLAYRWDDLPREILGEGVVLRVAPNAATVFLSYTRKTIYAGDYVEVE